MGGGGGGGGEREREREEDELDVARMGEGESGREEGRQVLWEEWRERSRLGVTGNGLFFVFFLPVGPRPRTYRHENLHCHEHLGWFLFLLMRRCYLQGPRLIGVT